MDIRGERLLHPDGRTAATDVARQGQQFLYGDEVALLVARHLGSQLQVYFVFAGDDADEMARLVAVQDEGLEHTIYILAQAGGYVYRAQVAFVHLVGDQFVGYLGLVQQPGCIGLIDLLFPIFPKLCIASIRLYSQFNAFVLPV